MRIGLLYQPRIEASAQHARRVRERLASDGHDAWVGSSWDIGDDPEPIRFTRWDNARTLARKLRGYQRPGIDQIKHDLTAAFPFLDHRASSAPAAAAHLGDNPARGGTLPGG